MYTLKVQDMTCGGCAASISKAVSSLPGVHSVKADPQTKDVVVDAAPEVSAEAVIAAISDAGFDEISVVETTR